MRIIVAAALVCRGAAAAFADPVERTWKTMPLDDGRYGYVQMTPCGPALCGVLVRAFTPAGEEAASPDIGRQMIWDMLAEGDRAYGSGKIWEPDRDKTHNGRMKLNGDKLSVSGCVPDICRDGCTWTRVQ